MKVGPARVVDVQAAVDAELAQRAQAPRCKAFGLTEGKQVRCILGDAHQGEHDYAPADASADQLRPAAGDQVTIRIVVDGRRRVATFINPAKIEQLLGDRGTLGAFMRSLRDQP